MKAQTELVLCIQDPTDHVLIDKRTNRQQRLRSERLLHCKIALIEKGQNYDYKVVVLTSYQSRSS